jgi:hypothetical protein
MAAMSLGTTGTTRLVIDVNGYFSHFLRYRLRR